jgi:hypothetical protein
MKVDALRSEPLTRAGCGFTNDASSIDEPQQVRLAVAAGMRVEHVGAEQGANPDSVPGHGGGGIHPAVRVRQRGVPRLFLEQLDEIGAAIASGL